MIIVSRDQGAPDLSIIFSRAFIASFNLLKLCGFIGLRGYNPFYLEISIIKPIDDGLQAAMNQHSGSVEIA